VISGISSTALWAFLWAVIPCRRYFQDSIHSRTGPRLGMEPTNNSMLKIRSTNVDLPADFLSFFRGIIRSLSAILFDSKLILPSEQPHLSACV
jgi:hypothetical protein